MKAGLDHRIGAPDPVGAERSGAPEGEESGDRRCRPAPVDQLRLRLQRIKCTRPVRADDQITTEPKAIMNCTSRYTKWVPTRPTRNGTVLRDARNPPRSSAVRSISNA